MLNISKIEKFRKKSGLTITQLVELLEITDTTYNNLKKTRDFRVLTLEKMAKIFGIKVTEFFDESNLNEEKTLNNLAKNYELKDSEKQNNLLREPFVELNKYDEYQKIMINKMDTIIELLEKKY
jgi:transcriptional regulator with XRE-family HTH domain